MNGEGTTNHKDIYIRIIALWAISEAFAGGLLHALRLPFTGLIVSSLSVCCIILIAFHFPFKGSIIKACIIVAIFKLLLSPHSPPTAYLALFFQGLTGQLLFSRRFSRTAAIFLGILALAESSVQRILVLVIIYGNTFWNAVNLFIARLFDNSKPGNYMQWLAVLYISIHILAGWLIGVYAYRLARSSNTWKKKYPELIIKKEDIVPENLSSNQSRKRKFRLFAWSLWLVLIAFYAQSYFDPINAILPRGLAARILARAVILVLGWFLVLSPLVMSFVKKRLAAQALKRKSQVDAVMQILPETKFIFTKSLEMSNIQKGLGRLKLFSKILMVNILSK